MNISVIICTYNNCKSLIDTLKSLEYQDSCSKSDFEVIVVNNNSQDSTNEVVEEFNRQGALTISVVFEKRQGIQYARNAGITASKGEIIAFTDDDCLADSKYIHNLISIFQGDANDFGFVGGRILPIWMVKEVPRWITDKNKGVLALLDYGNQRFYLDQNNIKEYKSLFYGANFAFRKYVFDKYGKFDLTQKYAQDTEMCTRLIKSGVRGLYCPELTIHHKIPENRLKKKYFYQWYQRRGKYSRTLNNWNKRYYHVFNLPWWLFKAYLKEWIYGNIESISDKEISHRCKEKYYKGMIEKQMHGIN